MLSGYNSAKTLNENRSIIEEQPLMANANPSSSVINVGGQFGTNTSIQNQQNRTESIKAIYCEAKKNAKNGARQAVGSIPK